MESKPVLPLSDNPVYRSDHVSDIGDLSSMWINFRMADLRKLSTSQPALAEPKCSVSR